MFLGPIINVEKMDASLLPAAARRIRVLECGLQTVGSIRQDADVPLIGDL